MSAGWSVRSKGRSFFAFVQADLTGMEATYAPGSGSEFDFGLEVALDGLPTKITGDDEIHPLFCYTQADSGGADLLTMGITPSGRIKCLTPGGGVVQTAAGLMLPDGIARSWGLTYTNAGFGQLTITGPNGTPVVVATTNALPGGQPQPAAGHRSMFVLFNGRDMYARHKATIRRAVYGGEDGGVEWAIDEGGDRALHGKVTGAGDFPGINFDLAPHLAIEPWGPYTEDVSLVASYYAWILATEYTLVDPPSTSYEISQI